MALILRYDDWRFLASLSLVVTATDLVANTMTVTAAPKDLVAGQTFTVQSTGTNPSGLLVNTTYFVASPIYVGGTVTFQATLTFGGAPRTLSTHGSGTIVLKPVDLRDGMRSYALALVRVDGSMALSLPVPFPSFPGTLSCNEGVADAVPGVHMFDWYLSQRSDDPARQYLELVQPDPLKSGTVALGLTSRPGFSPQDTSADGLRLLFRKATLFARRRSSGAIWPLQLDPASQVLPAPTIPGTQTLPNTIPS